MKKRHHVFSVLILILVMPFILSCGIPTEDYLCEINFLNIKNIDATEENSVKFGLKLDFDYLSNAWTAYLQKKITDGPSVILFYALSDDYTLGQSTIDNVVSLLNTKLKESKVPNLKIGEAFVTSTVDTSFKIYPFLNDDELPFLPSYNYSLKGLVIDEIQKITSTGYDNFNYTCETTIKPSNYGLKDTEKGTQFVISAKNDTSSNDSALINLQETSTPSQSYVFIFAALSSGAGTFKIPSWSDSAYIGYLELDKD